VLVAGLEGLIAAQLAALPETVSIGAAAVRALRLPPLKAPLLTRTRTRASKSKMTRKSGYLPYACKEQQSR
jgi:hypothetical protein